MTCESLCGWHPGYSNLTCSVLLILNTHRRECVVAVVAVIEQQLHEISPSFNPERWHFGVEQTNIDQLMSRTRRQKSDCDEWVFVSHTITFLYALLHLQETHCGWRRDVTDLSINSSDCWINHRKIKSHLCPERERKHPAANFWSQGHKRKLCCRKKLQMVARSPWISRPQGGARWAL